MAALDSLLRIVDQQGANELRLGSDKAPSMYAAGVPKKLTMPATSTEALRGLFGDLLDTSRLGTLDKLGRIEFTHEAERIGSFRVTITKRPTGELAFDAIVSKVAAGGAGAPPHAPPGSSPPPPAAQGFSAQGTAPQPKAVALGAPLPPPDAAPHTPPRAAWTPPRAHPYRLSGTLEGLLGRAIAMGASDVHLSEQDPPVARIHGQLVELQESLHESLFDVAAATFGPALEERLSKLVSCDAAIDLPNGGRGRINVFSTSRGLAIAIRILPSSVPALASLGFPLPIDELARLPHGLVLVVGATGSGKSTTLAALAQEAVSSRSIHLVTLEDPIEYVFERSRSGIIRQRQIGRDVRDFATGLRDSLREDPDVLLIGEMRDAESIQLALTAAETGHLVLASLHSRSAVSTIERIIDTYPSERQAQIRVMLADSLRAVVAQRLLPSEAGTGRVLAAEILRVTTSVATAIREAKLGSMRSAMQAGRADGMIVLERALADLVRYRRVSIDAARAAANDVSTLSQYLRE